MLSVETVFLNESDGEIHEEKKVCYQDGIKSGSWVDHRRSCELEVRGLSRDEECTRGTSF